MVYIKETGGGRRVDRGVKDKGEGGVWKNAFQLGITCRLTYSSCVD